MRVKGFMTSADKLITVNPNDTIQKAMNLMMEHKISSVVVMKPHEEFDIVQNDDPTPLGIVTKTDLIYAYQHSIRPIDHEVQEIMTKVEDLVPCHPNQARDEAARILERSKNHHALVIDPTTNHFLGIVSSWDIAAECARDDRAWPWNRSEDGRFHPPTETPTTTTTTTEPTTTTNTSPKSSVYHPTNGGDPKLGDSFRDYVDNLGYFD